MTDRAETLLSDLRGRGERITPARRAIVEALVAAHGHLSAEDLVDQVQEATSGTHRATVYRTLDTLERLGAVVHIHLGHGRAIYHLADDLHQHLVCEDCGAVEEAPQRLFDSVQRRLKTTNGFVMRPYHFAVVGRCRSCATAAPEGHTPRH